MNSFLGKASVKCAHGMVNEHFIVEKPPKSAHGAVQ
jgi:hypothetical protein